MGSNNRPLPERQATNPSPSAFARGGMAFCEPVGARRILIVEDATEVADLVAEHLRPIAQQVACVSDGEQALWQMEHQFFDLIVLDLVLPGMDGLEVCRALRARGQYIPILMLTGKKHEVDRIVGLESGADDYVVKPFSVLEVVARVRALYRRFEQMRASQNYEDDTPLCFEGLVIDPRGREVQHEGRRIVLTGKEFELLLLLARNPGRVYSRKQLLDRVWGYGGDVFEHTVNSHVSHLRAKLETDPARPSLIETVWGFGYRFVSPLGR